MMTITTETLTLFAICSFLFVGGIINGLYREGIIIEFGNIKIYKRDNHKIDRKSDDLEKRDDRKIDRTPDDRE